MGSDEGPCSQGPDGGAGMSHFQDMHKTVCPDTMARGMGLIAVAPSGDELQLDIDAPSDMDIVASMLDVLERNDISVEIKKQTRSKSGNAHLYVRIDWPSGLDPVTRIALQACLGSDRKRELLSLLRHVFKTQTPPTVLFEVSA